MPAFPKPTTPYTVNVSKEYKNLAAYQKSRPDRAIPESKVKNLRIATWNIANLGLQKREKDHYKIIAKIISWFDVISIQEVNDNLEGFREIQSFLPKKFKAIFSDASGNNERMTFIYDTTKVETLEKIGELAVAAEDLEDIKIDGITQEFRGFSRTPYLATFIAEKYRFALINVHLYFGDDDLKESIDRRCLETYCVARWADLRRQSKNAFTPNILAMGDFNLPKVDPTDPVYKALTMRGLELPEHSSKIYSNISNDKNYDQIAFLPGIKNRILSSGVFDFDGALFPELWDREKPLVLRNYLRYYISDHRPKWIELDIS